MIGINSLITMVAVIAIVVLVNVASDIIEEFDDE